MRDTCDCSSSPRVVWMFVCAARSSRPRRDTFVPWNTRVASKPIVRMRAISGESFPSCLTYLLPFLQSICFAYQRPSHTHSAGSHKPGNYVVGGPTK